MLWKILVIKLITLFFYIVLLFIFYNPNLQSVKLVKDRGTAPSVAKLYPGLV